MKRRSFIKAFAAACAVPVVAAKAIASHKRPKSILDYKPTAAYSTRKLYSGDVYRHVMYDQSGNGNNLIHEKRVWFDSDWGQVKVTQSAKIRTTD